MEIPLQMPRIGTVQWQQPTGGTQLLAEATRLAGEAQRQIGSAIGSWGAAFDQLAQTTGKLIQKTSAVGASNEFSNATTQTQLDFQNWMSALPKMELRKPIGTSPDGGIMYSAPDYNKILEEFDKWQAEKYGSTSKGFTKSAAKEAFNRWYAEFMPAMREKAMQFRIGREGSAAATDFDKRVEIYRKNRDFAGMERDAQSLERLGFFDPEKVREFLNKQKIEIDRERALDDIKAYGFEEGMRRMALGIYKELLPTAADEAAVMQGAENWNNSRLLAERAEFVRKNKGQLDLLLGSIESGAEITEREIYDPNKWTLTDGEKQIGVQALGEKAQAAGKIKQETLKAEMMRDKTIIDTKVANRESFTGELEAFAEKYGATFEPEVDELLGDWRVQIDDNEVTRWESSLSKAWARKSLTQEAVDKTADHPNPKIRGTADKWAGRLLQQEADKTAGTGADKDPAFESELLSLILRNDSTVAQIQDWMTGNRTNPQTGAPRLSVNTFMNLYNNIEKWKQMPLAIQSQLQGLDAEFDELIRREYDPDQRRKYMEEKVRVMNAIQERFQQAPVNVNEVLAYEKTMRDETLQKKADQAAHQAIEMRVPERQMQRWAQDGRLDAYGRLIGVPFKTQLNMLGIESFDELDWRRRPREYAEIVKSGADPMRISGAPPPWWESQQDTILESNGQAVMRNIKGKIVTAIIRRGIGYWVDSKGNIVEAIQNWEPFMKAVQSAKQQQAKELLR